MLSNLCQLSCLATFFAGDLRKTRGGKGWFNHAGERSCTPFRVSLPGRKTFQLKMTDWNPVWDVLACSFYKPCIQCLESRFAVGGPSANGRHAYHQRSRKAFAKALCVVAASAPSRKEAGNLRWNRVRSWLPARPHLRGVCTTVRQPLLAARGPRLAACSAPQHRWAISARTHHQRAFLYRSSLSLFHYFALLDWCSITGNLRYNECFGII